MTTETKKEKTKKHLKKMFPMFPGMQVEEAVEENFKYFEYLIQPAKIADAIARVI